MDERSLIQSRKSLIRNEDQRRAALWKRKKPYVKLRDQILTGRVER